jgi:hypothetical protein
MVQVVFQKASLKPKIWAMVGRLDYMMVNNELAISESAYRPLSRMALDCPINTAIKFPNELSEIKKFSPLTAFPEPKTAVKNRLAAT